MQKSILALLLYSVVKKMAKFQLLEQIMWAKKRFSSGKQRFWGFISRSRGSIFFLPWGLMDEKNFCGLLGTKWFSSAIHGLGCRIP